MKNSQNRTNSKISWKEFFRVSWKKTGYTLILGFLVLFLVFYLLIFRSPNKITPLVIGTLILAPSFLLFLFINLKLRMDIHLIFYLILEIVYIYLLVCGFLWINNKINNRKNHRRRIIKTILMLLVICLILTLTFQFWKGVFVKTPYPDNIEEVVITMDRGLCFGTCPSYSIKIYGNGTVIYHGDRFVKVPGDRIYSIGNGDVKNLVDYFIEVNYFALEDSYFAHITDASSVTTSITINGQTKSIYRYVSGPSKLKDLENKIYEVSRVEQFVGNIRDVRIPEECEEYPEDLRGECYSSIIYKFENSTQCDVISNEDYRNRCLESIKMRDLN